MGIKNINKFLKDNFDANKIYKTVPGSEFAGSRVAIDATNQMCSLWSQAHKDVVGRTDVCLEEPSLVETERVFLVKAKDFVKRLMGCGITPVLVFDGKHPGQKSDTQKKRREKKQAVMDKIAEYRRGLDQLDVLERTTKMNSELRTLYLQVNSPSYSAIGTLRSILTEMGIPVLQAVGEAEQLCCMLYLDGYVSAVMSTDTDVMTYSCSLLITGFSGGAYNPQTGRYETQFTCVYLNSILQELKMTYPMFVDFCIMCGCDYNTNMPRIAAGKSYKLLTEFGSIENLPGKYDTSCLNYEFCRDQFKYRRATELSETHFTTCGVDVGRFEHCRGELLRYGVESWYDEFQPLIRQLSEPPPERVVVNRAPLPVKLNVRTVRSSQPQEHPQDSQAPTWSSPMNYIDAMLADLDS